MIWELIVIVIGIIIVTQSYLENKRKDNAKKIDLILAILDKAEIVNDAEKDKLVKELLKEVENIN